MCVCVCVRQRRIHADRSNARDQTNQRIQSLCRIFMRTSRRIVVLFTVYGGEKAFFIFICFSFHSASLWRLLEFRFYGFWFVAAVLAQIVCERCHIDLRMFADISFRLNFLAMQISKTRFYCAYAIFWHVFLLISARPPSRVLKQLLCFDIKIAYKPFLNIVPSLARSLSTREWQTVSLRLSGFLCQRVRVIGEHHFQLLLFTMTDNSITCIVTSITDSEDVHF